LLLASRLGEAGVMRVADIMTTTVRTVTPGSLVDEVLDLLITYHLTSLPVLHNDAVVGVVSEADVVRALVARDPRAHVRPVRGGQRPPQLVEAVMSSPAGTVRPEDDVHDVLARFADRGWKSAPVLDGGRLVGVVSRSDVVRALHRPDDAVAAAVGESLREVGHAGWDVSVRRGVVTITGPHGAKEHDVAERVARTVPGVRHVVVDDT
jgi:CBS-domain-containing membrane protein